MADEVLFQDVGFRIARGASDRHIIGGAAEPKIVPVGVAVGGLPDAVRVGFLLYGDESTLCNARDNRVEVVDKDEVPGVSSVLGPLLNEDEPVLGELPHGLGVIGDERRRRAEESLIPPQGDRVVADRDPGEQITGHARRASRAGRCCVDWRLSSLTVSVRPEKPAVF